MTDMYFLFETHGSDYHFCPKPNGSRTTMSNELVLNFCTRTMVLCRFSAGPTMVLRKRNSCINIIMLTIFDTAYTVIIVFSVTPPMLLEHIITFVRRSCMLAVFRSRIEGAASLQSFPSKTEGSCGNAFSVKNRWFRMASSSGFSVRNRWFRMEPPRVISFKNRGCVLFQNEGVMCTRDPILFILCLLSLPSPRRGHEVTHNLGHFKFGG